MKHIILIIMMLIVLVFTGCSADRAGELFETAQFEELQNNKEHAMQLYGEIIKKYPESIFAKKAEERLSRLKE